MTRRCETSIGEYQRLKGFVLYFADKYLSFVDLPENERIANVVSRIEIEKGKDAALVGLKQALNDCMEMTKAMTLDEIIQFDAELSSHGIMTLSEARLKYSKSVARILKNRRLSSAVDYYLAKGILAQSSMIIEDGIRQLFSEAVDSYESTHRNPRPSGRRIPI